MIHTYVEKKARVYRYYVCVKAHQRGWAQCETRCVSAPALESAVLQQLRGIGTNPTIMRNVLRQSEEHRRQDALAASKEKAHVARELQRVADEIGGAGSAGDSGSITRPPADLEQRANRLRVRLSELQHQLEGVSAQPTDPRDLETALHAFDPLWEQLSTWEQERFIHTLVEQVRYDGKTGTVTLGFRSSGIKDLCSWVPVIKEKYEHAQERG
jgi:site-specific DNA recombinase